MADRSRKVSGGNGATTKPEAPNLKSMLQKYLDSFVPDDDDLESAPTPSAIDTLDSDERLTLEYQGQTRTTTGVVRIMRESGNTESADLLEALHQTQETARKLLDDLKDLHKRKTGTYPKLAKARTSET